MWGEGLGLQTGGFSQEVSKPGWARASAVKDGHPSAVLGAALPSLPSAVLSTTPAWRRHGSMQGGPQARA